MTLWGESEDPSKATLWTFPEEPQVPEDQSPTESISVSPSPTEKPSPESSTKTGRPSKPTEHLPDDHDISPGDTSNPAFPDPAKPSASSTDGPLEGSSTLSFTSTSSSKPTPSYTPDEGYFTHMGDLLQNQTWLFVAIGFVLLFAAAGGVFFWQRRSRRRGGNSSYSAVAGIDDPEDMAMSVVEGSSRRLLGRTPGRSKDLYDAFGEPEDDSEDEDDAHEDDRLVHRGPGGSALPDAGLQYHDGFLEDDHPDSAQASPSHGYRDEPPPISSEGSELRLGDRDIKPHDEGRSSSPSGGSGDSWEHADPGR